MTGFIAGIVGLALLQVAVTNPGHTASVISLPAELLSRWLNPSIPLIPDRRQN